MYRQRKFRELKAKQAQERMKKRLEREKRKAKRNVPNSPSLSGSCNSSKNVETQVHKPPSRYKKQIRQRHYDCRQKLPRSPGLRCFVVAREVERMLHSPRTGGTMSQVLNRCRERASERVQRHENTFLQRKLLQIKKYKAAKNEHRCTTVRRKSSCRRTVGKTTIHGKSFGRKWIKSTL